MKINQLQKNIPKGWEIKKIKDLLVFERPDEYIVKDTSYGSKNKTPVLTANKSFILGYTDENFGICNNIPAIIFDDFTTDSKYVDFPFKIKSSAIKILRSKNDEVDLKFVYEIMKNINFPIANHKRHYISQYQEQEIIVPLIKEQKKIAEIFSKIDEEINKTDELISKTEELKNGLINKLFIKGINHKKFKKTKLGEIPEEWNIGILGDLLETSSGGTPLSNKIEYYENGSIPWLTSSEVREGEIYKSSKFITKDALKNSSAKIFPINTVLIAMYGVTAGQVGILKIESSTNQAICGIYPSSNFIPEFLYQYFLSQTKSLRSLAGGGAQPNISQKIIREQLIPVPSYTEQKQISEILLSIDKKLNKQKELKEKLTQLKKGLMSDLLSGKVRV